MATNGYKFDLGFIYITTAALRALEVDDCIAAWKRHAGGDWGEISEDDRRANEIALVEDLRILSAYTDRHGTRFWIITEADRSTTTILLPDDY